jgi:hypothetical protein
VIATTIKLRMGPSRRSSRRDAKARDAIASSKALRPDHGDDRQSH